MVNIQNCAIVILGASGDLASRKLLPALEALFSKGKICSSIAIIGCGRTPFTDDSFRSHFSLSEEFSRHLYYHQYIPGLKKYIDSLGSFSRIIFFLAQPPSAYGPTARELAAEGFSNDVSLIIEKPFGYDYDSARALNSELAACFSEEQIYRVDHYLGKEAVQNIMVFRFANSIFNPVWNSQYVDSIQISALENISISERGGYFDKTGIIRDMVQNHLLQLLALLTMEAPVNLNSDEVKIQKINLLKTVKIETINRYQYKGYKAERAVHPDSTTETFAELKMSINNYRWSGMPIYIRTGKAVHRQGTEIGVRFKPLPKLLFNEQGDIPPNQILFKIQPAEGIVADLSTKTPGTDEQISPTYMNFCYNKTFATVNPEAYQRLLFDALRGDHTLFVSAAETEISWSLFKGLLDKGEVSEYPKGCLPQSKLDVQWIDFDKYVPFCT
jgi:glucose-6-phosphate 1-dehydrogenase